MEIQDTMRWTEDPSQIAPAEEDRRRLYSSSTVFLLHSLDMIIDFAQIQRHNLRRFCYLSLFTFMMTILVTANCFLPMFVG